MRIYTYIYTYTCPYLPAARAQSIESNLAEWNEDF